MQTVENIISKDIHNKIWLCPHEVLNSTFERNPLLQGIECTRGTVPKELLDKSVDKTFVDNGFLCIIWRNI